jgi:hypothetical protein
MRRAAIILLLPLAACGALYAEVDEPEVCKTLTSQRVPGVPDAGTQSVVIPFSFDLRKEVGNTAGATGEVELTKITLTAQEGISDFAFIDTADVDVNVPNSSGGFVPVLAYQRPASYAPSPVLVMPGNGANIFPYVKSGAVAATLQLTGTLPGVPWLTDIQACVHVRVTH